MAIAPAPDQTTFPAYLRSVDPHVIASIRERDKTRKQWQDDMGAYADKHTGTGSEYFARIRSGRLCFGGLADKPETGRWVRGNPGWRPYSNDRRYAEHEALTRDDPKVEGMPQCVFVHPANDAHPLLVTPVMFVHDGVAWAKAAEGYVDHPEDAPDPRLWAEASELEWDVATADAARCQS